jgi:glutathione S-transferase
MYTLYARKGAGSFVIEALLAELGLKYKIIEATPGADGTPHRGLLKLNPLGQVPTLVLPDKTVMTESVAMVVYLADRYGKAGLAPAPGSKQRAAYLRWLLFMAANLYPEYLRYFYSDRYSTDPAAATGIKAAAVAAINRSWEILARGMGKGPWFLGKKFSALDLYVAMMATWMEDQAGFRKRHARIRDLTDAVRARPRVTPVWTANAMP